MCWNYVRNKIFLLVQNCIKKTADSIRLWLWLFWEPNFQCCQTVFCWQVPWCGEADVRCRVRWVPTRTCGQRVCEWPSGTGCPDAKLTVSEIQCSASIRTVTADPVCYVGRPRSTTRHQARNFTNARSLSAVTSENPILPVFSSTSP